MMLAVVDVRCKCAGVLYSPVIAPSLLHLSVPVTSNPQSARDNGDENEC